ncbi:MAG: apolipoprotein N-acyltransferase [Planctomycetota bacterium]|jgi:apolipoprotein N-acyltransferase
MDKEKVKRRALTAGAFLLSVLLLYLAFPPVDAGLLILVAFVPWLGAMEGMSFRKAALVSASVGFLFSLFCLSWIAVVTVAGLLITALYVAVLYGLRGVGVTVLRRWFSMPLALAAPLAFVTAEWVQSFFLTGFPWVFAGHALYRQKILIQIADLTGSYGVTALVLAVNGALLDGGLAWRGREKGRRALITGGAAALFLLVVLLYGALTMRVGEETGPELLLIQGNIPQEVKDSGQPNLLKDIWDTHLSLTLDNAREKSDLIVWPETMVPGSLTTDVEKLNGAVEMAQDLDTDLLLGSVRIDPGPNGALMEYNSAMLIRRDGTLGGHYDKAHRVPGGEYIPFRRMFPVLEPILHSMFGYLPDVAPADSLACLEHTDRHGTVWRFGVLVCYGAIFPELARPQVRQGARYIINVTNEGWFGDCGEQEQIQAAACFRAVENRRTVVRAANTGITALIGPDGDIYSVFEKGGLRENVEGTFRARVRLDGRRTVYTAVGNLFAWLVALATLVLGIVGGVRAHRRRAEKLPEFP